MTAGSLTLVGGGWDGGGRAFAPFLAAAAARRAVPRVAVIAVRDGDAEEHAARLVAELPGRVEPRIAVVAHGGAVPAAVLDDVDGVLVGGGLTPAHLDALLPVADRIRALVAGGVPYAGFSAGSAIAARRALLGGWRLDGTPVVDEEVGEDLDALTVRDGLGLTDLTLDVHAAQWGTLARAMAAVEAGLVPRAAAIDERTALVLDERGAHAAGDGNVWWIERAGDAVAVRRRTAR
ncbi:Type 1 glutamine amidotransferase-like domain-containing protein [Amnibacterium sp. CER49]|uniref:Type 1 glutamine amidotransferase-like domain-containing protein n=1 Tax=Amnibacterium sp. CER49 TaxID=3039161 RepID=UPI00244CF73E|nr:Type 1 glutamine amidotransferase-like domain-containing protein [Amnibacterium sp. CER49]MDH2445232.1 Type 1 glutamine amidotransferase-like domain-containing protein [Amnibacterium sp. CER49]